MFAFRPFQMTLAGPEHLVLPLLVPVALEDCAVELPDNLVHDHLYAFVALREPTPGCRRE